MRRVMTRRREDKGFGCFVHALLGYMEIRSRIPDTEQIILAVTYVMVRYTVRILTRAPGWILQASLRSYVVRALFRPYEIDSLVAPCGSVDRQARLFTAACRHSYRFAFFSPPLCPPFLCQTAFSTLFNIVS